MKDLQNKKLVVWLFILAALVLITPSFVRISQGNPSVGGEETYYDIRMAEQIRARGILEEDTLQQRPYSFDLFHYLLAGLGFVDIRLLAYILPPVFGMLFFWFGYKVLRQFKPDNQFTFLILLMVLLTPIFVLIFTTLNKFALVLLLSVLGFYCLISEKSSLKLVSAVLFALIPLLDFFAFILTFVLLSVYMLIYKKNVRLILASFAGSLIFMLCAFFFLHYRITYSEFITNSFSLRYFLTDFGAVVGYSFFIFLLAVMGFVLSWRKKKSLLATVIILALFVFSFFNAPMRIYVSLVFAIIAAYAFDYFIDRKWSLDIVKRVTLLIILCTLIFSTASFLNRQFENPPNPALLNALQFLRQAPHEGAVLTHQSNGFYVEYFSGRPAVLDDFSDQYPGYKDLLSDTEQVFATRDLISAERYLTEHKVRYILVDEAMQKGLVWRRPQEGMLFLLENSEKFIKVYSEANTDIYLYRGADQNA